MPYRYDHTGRLELAGAPAASRTVPGYRTASYAVESRRRALDADRRTRPAPKLRDPGDAELARWLAEPVNPGLAWLPRKGRDDDSTTTPLRWLPRR